MKTEKKIPQTHSRHCIARVLVHYEVGLFSNFMLKQTKSCIFSCGLYSNKVKTIAGTRNTEHHRESCRHCDFYRKVLNFKEISEDHSIDYKWNSP